MEASMAAAAAIEIFLASVGLAAMLAALALRGAFWLMRGTTRRIVLRPLNSWETGFIRASANVGFVTVHTGGVRSGR